jgi:predicted acetyltransferase
MDIKLEGFYIENAEYYQHTLNLRSEIFSNNLGLNKHIEFDGLDVKATHYIVLCNNKPVGCARWIEHHDFIRIDRFGILKDYQHRGFGLILIKLIISELMPSRKKIELLSTADSVIFFIHQGFKDNNVIEDLGNLKVRVLTL